MNTSILTQIDARTKLLLTLLGAITTVVFSSLAAQLMLFAMSFIMALLIKRISLIFILYLLMSLMM